MRTLLLAFLLTSSLALEGPRRGFAAEDSTTNCSAPQTYRGCVVRSGGKIMLTDAQNRDYILVSSGWPLENYVGQEVELCATSIIPEDPTSNERGINRQPGQPRTLNVGNLQKVQEKCISPKSTDKK